MFFIVLLCLSVVHSQGIHVLVFGDAFGGERNLCAATKVAFFMGERETEVSLVVNNRKNESHIEREILNVVYRETPDTASYNQAEHFYLSYFDDAEGIYPDIICLPEYDCVVTHRPNAIHYQTLQNLVNKVEANALDIHCDSYDDHRGSMREKSDICFYLKDKKDCRPPQSFLEKEIQRQREWFLSGKYPVHFILESALQ